jgi:hypothetical protein
MKNRLFIFGSFAHDSQRILTAVHRLALVGVELCLNIGTLELSITPFAHANGWGRLLYDPQFALWHNCSLAHLAGRT